jgi:hypothetical protein
MFQEIQTSGNIFMGHQISIDELEVFIFVFILRLQTYIVLCSEICSQETWKVENIQNGRDTE